MTPVAPTTTDTLTCTVLATGGIPPYTYSYQWFNKYGTIYGWQPYPGATESTLALSDANLGRNFRCQVTILDSVLTGIAVTSNETQSVEPGVIAPVIGSVSLTEQNPHADPRFTSQSFDVAVTMTDDGAPGSVKSINAYVQGTITETKKFDEPLESSQSGSVTDTWSNYLSAVSQSDPELPGTGAVVNATSGFNGNNANWASLSTNATDDLLWDCSSLNIYPTTIRFYNTFGNRRNYFYFSDGSVYEINETTEAPSGGVYLEAPVPEGTKLEKVLCKFNGIFAAIIIDGSIVKDGETIVGPTTLVFGSSADMSALEAGDEVGQPSEIAARTWSAELSEQGGAALKNPENLFDGNTFSYCESFSYNANIIWDLSGYTLTGKLKVTVGLVNGTYVVLYKDKNNSNTSVNFPGSTGYFELDVEELNYIQVKYQDFQNYTRLNTVELDGEFIVDGQPIVGGVTGTVDSVTDTTVTLTEEIDGWADGVNVIGPEKTVVEQNARKYLQFSTDGNIANLLDNPQDPPFTTTAFQPSITFNFPSTFPSGETPDQELGEGTTLTVEASASNSAGSSGPVTASVQPDNTPPIIQFREPLLATSENQITRTWSNDCTSPGGSEANGFNGSLDSTPGVGTGSSGGGIVIWDTSAYPLTGNLVVYHWDEPGGTGPAQITVEDVNGDTTTYSKNVTETGNTSTDCGFNANIAKSVSTDLIIPG